MAFLAKNYMIIMSVIIKVITILIPKQLWSLYEYQGYKEYVNSLALFYQYQ